MVSNYTHSVKLPHNLRGKIVFVSIYLFLLVIISRLYYWQVIQAATLKVEAHQQYSRTITNQGQRGRIFTNDHYLLVGNIFKYRLVVYPEMIDQDIIAIRDQITPIILNDLDEFKEASQEAEVEKINITLKQQIEENLSKKDTAWAMVYPTLSETAIDKIKDLKINGLGFEPFLVRFYPEASMSAHVTGFLGKDKEGLPIGYFGIEGSLNKELSGKQTKSTVSLDGLKTNLFEKIINDEAPNGRDIILTIKRDLQYLTETLLEESLQKYQAKSGEVIIMEPSTGKILALATLPKYDQSNYWEYDPELYKNPTLTNLFEPGSIMKTLTISAGIDSGAITAHTVCTLCDGPRKIGKYTIRTWNDEYHPNIDMTEALAKSDNVAMIFAAEKIGSDKFNEYLKKFGLGEKINIDLHEDRSTPFPDKWGPVELATRSFGQGISLNSLQIIRAVGAIANHGLMMQPQIIQEVVDQSGTSMPIKPKSIRQVISEQTAAEVTNMMVYAAQSGEAQWAYLRNHSIAGKTGTSQIPDPSGGYQSDATIASFIGFAPPINPKFIMYVKLVEPKSSPWAAETAAPLWYKIATKLFLSLNIAPDNESSI